ncbi:PREDICTED: zinc finger CCCH domain-containing protein 22 [Tarenaya hassleriana]|uniref:zinc finger CCCH domain-containing protein 22 n=1 Tax=Tarenaya hassleriana TaxID=28532 RepID=UPI00053C8D2C|nr:PREDICTED: zinc finger CCCH domain-containing protein 22 [Tarenaya hassleriana]
MASEEEKALEQLLEAQLKDQRDSLAAIDEALASDPSNAELLSVHGELLSAIKDAEEGLLHLKRARLLHEADMVLHGFNHAAAEETKAEPLDPAGDDVEPEPIEEQRFSVGSKCRFRHTDGRWYNGQIIGFEGSDSAKISFLTPMSDRMLMCKFFMQQRCRFGGTCRLSHGLDLPVSSLKNFVQVEWNQSMVGSKICAVSGGKDNIWREAELESWDSEHQVGQVVFRDDGSSAKLGPDAMMLYEYAHISEDDDDDEEDDEDEEGSSDSCSEESASSDYVEETQTPQGLGFLESTNQMRGVQTETAVFAKWENHTRGIASKMMANMGYREGMGLGATGQGMLDPILVKVLPPKRSLDHALEHVKKTEEGKGEKRKIKRRSRGGKKKREKKMAEAARAARQEEESRPDVFSLINDQLSIHHKKVNGTYGNKKQSKGTVDEKKVDRRALVAYEDEIRDLKLQVQKLEEMVNRNRRDKIVYEAATRRLNEARKILADTEAAYASTSNAVANSEKEKKWRKF